MPRSEFDYTMMSDYQRCQRMFDMRHNRGLVNKTARFTAPEFGQGIHTALDSWYQDQDVDKAIDLFKDAFKEDETDDKRTHAMGAWIIRNYHEKYRDQPLKLLASEQHFELPMPNGNKLIGKIDKVVEQAGVVWIMDHKTTSSLGPRYFDMAEPNLQFPGYVWAARQLGYSKCQGVLVDAILVAKGLLQASSRARLTPLARFDSYIDDTKLKEWKNVARAIQQDVARSEMQGARGWTPNFASCTYYGECAYRRVCKEDEDIRERIIQADYRVEFWDPRGEK